MTDKRLKYVNKLGKMAARSTEALRPKSLRVKITSNGRLSFEDLTHALHKAFRETGSQGAAGASLFKNRQQLR